MDERIYLISGCFFGLLSVDFLCRKMEMNNKLTILGLIYENKNILFGKFSDQLTHERKINKWKEITDQLKALGIFNKDWKYLRDTTWQNWRKRTIEKRDNRLQTGSGGGKKCKYDDSDEMIFKIIGKDSPVVDGLQIPESSGSNDEQVSVPVSTPDKSNTRSGTPPPPPQKSVHRKSLPPRISISENDIIPNELLDLKKQKMEIEIKIANEKLEIAKREKYKLDLELLKLEKELNLQPSQFTLPLFLQNVQVIDSSGLQIEGREDETVDLFQSGDGNEQGNEQDILQSAINKSL